MAICSKIGVGIVWAALLVFGSVSSARAQFSEGPNVGNSLDGPDWYTINARIVAKLEKGDLRQLAHSLAKAQPTLDPTELMKRLNVFVRVGERSQAYRVIQAMAHTPLTENAAQSGAATDFLVAHGEWELARHLMDACPLATPSSAGLLAPHFEESSSAFPSLDRWLATRDHLNPAFWSPIYLSYRRKTGTLRPLLEERAADVRAHPRDLTRIASYLAVASRFDRPPNLSWLPTVCHFPLAVENLELGKKLPAWPAVAITFLERALQKPITFDDYVWLEVRGEEAPADFRTEPALETIRLEIKAALLERYQATQQLEKAQKLRAEIAAQMPVASPRNPGGFGGQGGFGALGGAPRSPVAEAENTNDYHTWMTRADGYMSRKEKDAAANAFQKALEITRMKPGENDTDQMMVMNAYFLFLRDNENAMAPAKWLRAELEQSPLESAYVHAVLDQMVRLLPANRPDFLPTQEILWRYLDSHKQWEWQEHRVLQEMVGTVQGSDRDSAWTRAEKLASGNPDRERVLGSLMQGMLETSRAIPILQDVVRQTQSKADRETLVRAEFDAALAKNDWPRTKALWLDMKTFLMGGDLEYWTRRLLDTAVQNHDADVAMVLFTSWTHADYNIYQETGNGREKAQYVARLASLGLQERLIRYYREMAAADPESHIPQDILPTLRNPPAAVAQPGGPPFAGNPSLSKPQPEIPVKAHAADPRSRADPALRRRP